MPPMEPSSIPPQPPPPPRGSPPGAVSGGAPPAPPAKRFSWTSFLVIASLIALAVSFVYRAAPREVARWHAAAAVEALLDQESERALEAIDKAISRDPLEPQFRSIRAGIYLELDDPEKALEDADFIVNRFPESDDPLQLRMTIYQALGRHAEAIADAETILKLSAEVPGISRHLSLNNVAYARALGNVDLSKALDEVDESLALQQPSKEEPRAETTPAPGPPRADSQSDAALDTRGYIRYLRGEYPKALEDMNAAVTIVETRLRNEPLVWGKSEVDPRVIRARKKLLARSVAVLRYHRALVYQKMKLAPLAEQDLARVRQLGFEPGEKLY